LWKRVGGGDTDGEEEGEEEEEIVE